MKHSIRLAALLLAATLAWACNDEETALGTALTDPNTRYNGQTDTWTATRAASVKDDSLVTSGATPVVIGRYADPLFGTATAEWYTQITLPSSSNSINFDSVSIDSVLLTLVKSDLFPDSAATYSLHFEVAQLAEAMSADTTYYASSTLPVDGSAVVLDSTVSVGPADTVISLRLNSRINSVLSHNGSADEFAQAVKGLRIRLADDSDPALLSINLNATDTRLRVFYSHPTTGVSAYSFAIGSSAPHFVHIGHDYSGTAFQGADSIDGAAKLYLEPLGGLNVSISFDNAVRAFAAAHPMAVIHHAELLLPVASEAPARPPKRIIATHLNAAGNEVYVADALDAETYKGFDGAYDASRGCYRLRVTQHVQQLLRQGSDSGMKLLIEGRRNNAERTVIEGYAASSPVKINIVYTE